MQFTCPVCHHILNCTNPIIGATAEENAGHIGTTLQNHLVSRHREGIAQIMGIVSLFHLGILVKFFRAADDEATDKHIYIWKQIELIQSAQWSIQTTAPPHPNPAGADPAPNSTLPTPND